MNSSIGRPAAARSILSSAAGEARRRPALALYLAALFVIPFQWLSPFSYPQAGLTDALTAAALLAWIAERVRARARPHVRGIHLAYGAYAGATLLSTAFASDRRLGAENLLIVCELIALAVMTTSFWGEPVGKRAISRVVIATVVVTGAEAVIGLALFYLGQRTSLTESYSGYFKASDLYARVAAGFASAPLMGSYCIFASTVIAMDVLGLSRRVRWALQGTLAVLTLITLSRAFIGFVTGLALRVRRSDVPWARLAGSVAVAACLIAMVALTVAPLSLDPFRPASSTADINPRLASLKTSFETFTDHPLVGAGPGTNTGEWQGNSLRAHFTPVNVAATSGLPALLALTAIVVILWRRRKQATSPVLWSGLAGLAVDALGQDAEHFRHVWVLLGIADAEREQADD